MALSVNFQDKVRLKKNPTPVEITYLIEAINVYHSPTTVYLCLRPDRNYPLSDGGYISEKNLREEKIDNVIFVD